LNVNFSLLEEKNFFRDLSEQKSLHGAPLPSGPLSSYTRGLMNNFSTTASTSVHTAITFVKDLASPKKKSLKSSTDSLLTDTEDTESLQKRLEEKLKEESNRFVEQSEANEKLQLQLIELQRESNELQIANVEKQQQQKNFWTTKLMS